MILSRVPMRMSFAGGGSDLPCHYRRHGGCVLSAAIDRYVYLAVHSYFEGDEILLKYSSTEKVPSARSIKHPVFREVLLSLGIETGLEITSMSDIPAGTGLGSSCAFTVALLQSLHAFLGQWVSKHELAEEAAHLEIDRLQQPIGKQDQFASAYGGINFIRFRKDERVEVTPILLSAAELNLVERNLMAFYTGGARSADAILREQQVHMMLGQQDGVVCKMANLAEELREALVHGQIDALGHVMDENWRLKQSLAKGITSPEIERMYLMAKEAGAVGGKLLGAGGQGFFLLYCPESKQSQIRAAFHEYYEHRFGVDVEGAKIIYVGNENKSRREPDRLDGSSVRGGNQDGQ